MVVLPHTFCVLEFLTLSNNNWTSSSVQIKFISGDSRSTCPNVFYKKDALENFAKFAGKHLCQGLFFNKVAGLRPGTLLKRDSGTGVFL